MDELTMSTNESLVEYVYVIDDNVTNATKSPPTRTFPYEYILALSIQRHYLKVLCAVGLPGNIAAILTISTIRPVTTAAFLVALLAVSDSAALVVKMLINQLALSLPTLPPEFCHSEPLTNVCSTYANWVLVVIALERLVAVRFPVARKRFLGKGRVYGICVFIFVLVFSVHAPIMANRTSEVYICRIKSGNIILQNYVKVLYWLNIVLYAVLPGFLLLILNLALCLSLRRARLQRQDLLFNAMACSIRASRAAREARRSEWAITAMVLAACLLLMLMVLPQCLYYVLFHYTDVYARLRGTAKDYLTSQVTTLLADSTHALNFYLYVVSVRRFRRQFLLLLRCSHTRSFRGWRCSVRSLMTRWRSSAKTVQTAVIDSTDSTPPLAQNGHHVASLDNGHKFRDTECVQLKEFIHKSYGGENNGEAVVYSTNA